MSVYAPGDIIAAPHTYQVETPQIGMRRVLRDGKEVLQQCWGVVTYQGDPTTAMPQAVSCDHVWRDVPLVTEE